MAEMSVLADPRTDLRCTGCGYGIVIEGAQAPPCPMCGQSAWQQLPWRPFPHQLDEALQAENLRASYDGGR
jgi:hypothetical protein